MSSRTPTRSPPSAKKRRQAAKREANLQAAARAREGLDADRIAQERQLAQQRRDEAKFRRELKDARRSFQTDTFSAPFGETTAVGAPANTTVVGAPVAQTGIDEFGAQDGTDLTVGFNRGREEPLGSDDTTRISQSWQDIPIVQPGDSVPDLRSLDVSSIPGTPSRSIFDDSTLPDALPHGLTTPTGEPAELDDRDISSDASSVNLSAAFDAYGNRESGLRASRGGDSDGTLHMDDYVAAIQEVQQLMREVSFEDYVQGRVAANRQAGQADAESSEEELESTSQFVKDKRAALKSFDRNDADAAAFNAGLADSDASDSESESEDEALELAEALNRPGGRASTAPAVEPLKQLDVVAKAEAARLLRDSPGILKLLSSRVFKFSDFLTDGEFDPQKLAKVRRVLAKRVDSTAESYKLAASAKGYTPSGAAFPIEGLNNIVAGVRKVPGSKYVMYQGPQYVDG
jgi:tellurite resistance protein